MENKEGTASTSLKELPIGHEFPSVSYELNQAVIEKYIGAVGESQDFLKSGVVPPLAIAACAITALSNSFAVPPGTIHAAQELEFLKIVPIGSTISCGGRIAHKLERGRLNLISIEISAVDRDDETVLSGKATIAVPD
jgi:acyl dehydratase